jgi:hypothetical protein
MFMAKKAEIGGVSRLRCGKERTANLSIDQFVGVGLGELAGNKHFFTVKDYYQSRASKNENPHLGDNGCDTLGFRIDYKASQAKKNDLLSYNLLVRPHERHEGYVYVLILVKTFCLTPAELVKGPQHPETYLIGWARDEMLPAEPVKSGIFSGAYRIAAADLNPIDDLKEIPKLESTIYERF